MNKVMTPRERSDGPVISMSMPAGNMSLESRHELVSPSVSFCLRCGWGPRHGTPRSTWLKAPCHGSFALRPAFGLSALHGVRVSGHLQIRGAIVHTSHEVLLYKGVYMCTACGYMASRHVKELAKPCGCVITPTRRSGLKKLCRGELPYSLQQWPVAPPPPVPLFLSL
jgi:hypothetical protein